MTPQDETAFENKLTEKYVLIPKSKLYYIVGGAVAVILVATGLSLASVFAYLRSEPAEIARKRIEQIRQQAEIHLKRLDDEGAYVRYGSVFAPVQSRTGFSTTIPSRAVSMVWEGRLSTLR